MANLIELINKKISELKNYDIDNDTAEFLKMFNTNVSELCHHDFIDLVMCFYIAKKETTLSQALIEKEKILYFLEDMTILDYEDVLCLSDVFYELKERYEDKLVNFTYDEYMSINDDSEVLIDFKELLKEYRSVASVSEINCFLSWMNDDELSDIICLSACLKGIEENLEKAAGTVNDLDIPDFLGSKLTRKLTDGYVKDVTGGYIKAMNKELEEDIEILRKYRNSYINKVNGLKRKINKQIKNLETLLDSVVKRTINVDLLLKLTEDKELIFCALKEIVKLKNEIYKKNFQTLKNYQDNPINIFEKMFHEYGYNFNLLTKEEQNLLMSSDTKVHENLAFVSSSSLSFVKENDFVFIDLLFLDMENLLQLDSLLLRKKINEDFILKHGKKFNSLTIKNLVKNINLLDMQKANFESILKYNDEILLDLNMDLFLTITSYDIDFKSPNIKQYEFIENPKLLNVIDSFIEIGLLSYIKTLPNLINVDSDNVIKRIILMKEMGIDYLNDRNTLNQMARSGKDFYVSDDDLNEFVYQNYQNFMDEGMFDILNNGENVLVLDQIPDEISYIEDYKKNNQLYVIGSNYFSRIKVLRCLKTLIDVGYTNYKEMLFNVLIYNYPNYISFEMIEELKNIDKKVIRKQLIN